MPERRLSVLTLVAALAGCAAPAATPFSSSVPASGPVAIALTNPGFESMQPGILGAPEGWFVFQHAGPHSYEFTLDGSVARGGAKSLRIDNVGPEVYGAIAQRLPAAAYRGKKLRYSVWLKTRDVAGGSLVGGAGPTLQAFRGGSPTVSDDATEVILTGTHDWTRREVTLTVPANADSVEVGAILGGPGTVWLDDAELAVVVR